MNGKLISNLLIVGYVFVVLGLLVSAHPVVADEDGMLPVDAKLGQYITPQPEYVSAAENEKVAQYIVPQPVFVSAAENEKVAQYIVPQAAAVADDEPVADDFDYEAAADNEAARWVAMGEFYASHGMLNETAVAGDDFDYEAAADNQAARWAAMGEFYASHGMLNEAAVARLEHQESAILQGAG